MIKKLLLIAFMALPFAKLSNSQSVEIPEKNYFAINASVGTDFNNAFYNPGLTYIIKKWGFSSDYYYGRSKGNTYYDNVFNLEIRRIAYLGKNSYFQIGTGISHLNGILKTEEPLYGLVTRLSPSGIITEMEEIGVQDIPKEYSSFGLPITTKFIIGFNETVAFNLGGYANLLGERKIYSVMVGLTFFTL